MTDTPTNPPIIPTWIHSWITFFKAHEKFIAIVVAGLLLWHFGNKGFDAYDNYEKNKQSEINKQIAVIHDENIALHEQIAKMQADFNAQLAKDQTIIAQKKQAVVVQQKIDAALPLPDLSNRWELLLALTPGSIAPKEDGTIAVTSDAAHLTVNELEKIPQLVDETNRLTTDLKSCTDLVAGKDTEIAGKQKELDLQVKGREQDAKVAKDNQRKSFWKGFKWGYVAGVATAIAIKVATVVK